MIIMNHEYKDLKQIKEKLRSIILHLSSCNLGLLMMLMKLQELNILLHENLKQIKEKLRWHVCFHASFSFRLPVTIMNHEYKDLKSIREKLRSHVCFQKSILNFAKMCVWLQKDTLFFLLYLLYLSVSSNERYGT